MLRRSQGSRVPSSGSRSGILAGSVVRRLPDETRSAPGSSQVFARCGNESLSRGGGGAVGVGAQQPTGGPCSLEPVEVPCPQPDEAGPTAWPARTYTG